MVNKSRRKLSEILKRYILQNSNEKVFVLESVFNKNARLDFRPARKFPCIKNTSEFTVFLQEDLI